MLWCVHRPTLTEGSSEAAPTSWDLVHTACPVVCFCLPAASSATSPSHCILVFSSVTKSTPLSLSVLSFFLSEGGWCTLRRIPPQSQHCCCCCLSGSADCLLWARHWSLHDHMFLSCHQPKDKHKAAAAAALFGTKQRSACSVWEICFNLLLHRQGAIDINIDCRQHASRRWKNVEAAAVALHVIPDSWLSRLTDGTVNSHCVWRQGHTKALRLLWPRRMTVEIENH